MTTALKWGKLYRVTATMWVLASRAGACTFRHDAKAGAERHTHKVCWRWDSISLSLNLHVTENPICGTNQRWASGM